MSTVRTDIPGLFYIGDPPHPDDHRLKVLWFEDEEAIGITSDLERFIQVTWALVPDAAEAVLARDRAAVRQAELGKAYDLPGCPHDVYIADFSLRRAPKNEIGSLSKAARAIAAGLTSSVIMATNFPSHAATVLPYTAYAEQLAEQRELLKRFCPDYVNVRWGDELGKMELGVEKVLKDAIMAHREFLPHVAEQGIIHLSFAEKRRLTELVAKHRKKQTLWSKDETIELHTGWGVRTLFLSSLWPDLAIRTGPFEDAAAERVTDWLERFPTPGRAEEDAAVLAYTYFARRISLRSWSRYQLSNHLRDGIGPQSSSTVKNLCEQIELNQNAVQAYAEALGNANEVEYESDQLNRRKSDLAKAKKNKDGLSSGQAEELTLVKEQLRQVKEQLSAARKETADKAKLVELPSRWTCPHLLTAKVANTTSDEAVRLAAIFLLVYEEARRWACSLLFGKELLHYAEPLLRTWRQGNPYVPEEEARKLARALKLEAEKIPGEIEEERGAPPSALVRKLAQVLIPLSRVLGMEPMDAYEFFGGLEWEPKELWNAMQPITTASIAQLLDPLPQQVLAADQDFQSGRIGRALARKELDLVRLVADGPAGMITQAECRAMERFAINIGFPKDAWPAWMLNSI